MKKKDKRVTEDIVDIHDRKESAVRKHIFGYSCLLFVLLVFFQTIQSSLFTPLKKELFGSQHLNDLVIFHLDLSRYTHWLYVVSYSVTFIAFCLLARYLTHELIAFIFRDRD